MYTVLENAKIVLALLKEHNIRHVVISPGGSNIPIAQGVQNDPFFKCYSVVDERSAMYFAIGLYLKLGVPIATSCTSAQATRNYVPGLTEAFYKHVPILAITMSKHPRYLYQDYMQCPIQTSLPEDAVKKSYSMPYISNENDRSLCIRTANEAILELTHHGLGPVQLNIEVLDSETWLLDKTLELPKIRVIKRYNYWDDWDVNLEGKKILIVIGEHIQFSVEERKSIDEFCESNDVFVYVNHTSNYHGKYSQIGFLTLMNMSQNLFEKQFKPDILITIGGITGDYGIYGKLFNATDINFEHWRISVDGKVVDTYDKLTKIFECPIEFFFQRLSKGFITEHNYHKLWNNLLLKEKTDMDLPFSNIYAAQQLHKVIPNGSFMNFAILNSLRAWSSFHLNHTIQCFSNIAAYGIDGCLSVLIGQSVETDQLCFHVTGDLAFFYDMNALGIRHIKNNVRVLLVNNDGGIEFKLGDLETKTDVSSYISAAGHFKNAKGWSETCGFKYISASNKNEFLNLIEEFVSMSNRPIVFELFTNSENEKLASSIVKQGNWEGDAFESLLKESKDEIRKILGNKGTDALKKLMNKK